MIDGPPNQSRGVVGVGVVVRRCCRVSGVGVGGEEKEADWQRGGVVFELSRECAKSVASRSPAGGKVGGKVSNKVAELCA